MAKEIPVYLFVGFLESGKTKFIQETFEDPNFDSGDKTLLLICEEGEEEYNPKKFAFPGVTVKVIEDKAEMNPQNLAKLEKESGAGRVVIEYNGMWQPAVRAAQNRDPERRDRPDRSAHPAPDGGRPDGSAARQGRL